MFLMKKTYIDGAEHDSINIDEYDDGKWHHVTIIYRGEKQ